MLEGVSNWEYSWWLYLRGGNVEGKKLVKKYEKSRGKEIGQEIWEIMVLINKGKCIFYGENYVVIFNKFMFCVVSLSIMSW
jgi:hypothetical protein